MPAEKGAKPLTDLGVRIQIALDEEKMSQNVLQQKAGIPSRGYVSRLMSGARGTRMDPLMMMRIADVLHVKFEWLCVGRGSMREKPLEERSARDRAIVAARGLGALESAIDKVCLENEERPDRNQQWWLERFLAKSKSLRHRETPEQIASTRTTQNYSKAHATAPKPRRKGHTG